MYNSSDLREMDYSYEYISSENINLATAVERDERLDPDGPPYKPLVIRREPNLAIEWVQKIHMAASAGLPIVISGGQLGLYATGDSSEARDSVSFEVVLKAHTVAYGEVAIELFDIGVLAHIFNETNG